MRELYIYWHVAPADLAAATAGLAMVQATLSAQHPGLQCRGLRRCDEGGAKATLMETYAHASGIDAAMQTQIVVQGARAIAPWCDGPRHVEVFEPLQP